MNTPFLKSVLHNVGVVAVGLGLGYLGTLLDAWIGLPRFGAPWTTLVGAVLILVGFALRVWAAVHFYRHAMSVIRLEPQGTLLTTGPYTFSRNPLYLGGNVFIFFGAGLLLGSPSMLAFTVLHLPFVDWFVRREERQLEQTFGKDWLEYKARVRRWL